MQGFVHFTKDMLAATFGLSQCNLHDLFVDASDLDVHLQGGDTAIGSSHLEVHIAEMIFVTKDIGQNNIVVTFHDETHGDPGDRALQRYTSIHKSQRGTTNGGH